jgi:uncharacterized protein (DUF58 family)
MPTRRGWVVLGLATLLAAAWGLFREPELLGAALVLHAGTLIGMLWVRLGSRSIQVERTLQPPTAAVGDQVNVTLTVSNIHDIPINRLLLEDRVENLGTAACVVAKLPGRTRASVPYSIACDQRGLKRIGPIEITVTDPLGLASINRSLGVEDRLIVHPRIHRLAGYPPVRGRDPSSYAARPEFASRGGEDFFTMREFRHGDDLRQVHWRSSAKRDQLMIRQLETPWQSRGLLILDTRSSAYSDADSFEDAVEGAASFFSHLTASGFDLDVLIGSTYIRSTSPLAAARSLEALALVTMAQSLDIVAVAGRAKRHGGEGALVVVTGHPDDDLIRAVRLLSHDYGSIGIAAVTKNQEVNLSGIGARSSVATMAEDNSWLHLWQRLGGRQWLSA